MVKYCVFEGCVRFNCNCLDTFPSAELFEAIKVELNANTMYLLYRNLNNNNLVVNKVTLRKNKLGLMSSTSPENIVKLDIEADQVLDFRADADKIYILGYDKSHNLFAAIDNDIVVLEEKHSSFPLTASDVSMTPEESGILHVMAESNWYKIDKSVETIDLASEYFKECVHFENHFRPISMFRAKSKLYIIRMMNGNLYLDQYTPDTGIRFSAFLAENVTDLDPKIVYTNEMYYVKLKMGHTPYLIKIEPMDIGVNTSIIQINSLNTNKTDEISVCGVEKSGNKYLVVYDGYYLRLLDENGTSVVLNKEIKYYQDVYGIEDKILLVSTKKHNVDVESYTVY